MITFFPSLVASVVGSFLGLRFPLRLFGRGEELHTTLALELARSGCIRFWMVSVVVDEVGRMDGWTPYAYDGRTALKTDGTGGTSNGHLHIWWKWM